MPPRFQRRDAAEQINARGDRPGPTTVFGLSDGFLRFVEADTNRISPSPSQARLAFDDAEIANLAESIKRVGLQQPILVRPGPESQSYILVAGERRLRAHKLLGRATIPALVTTGDPVEIGLIENVQRVDLDAVELARGITQLMEERDYSPDAVGRIVGLDESRVRRVVAVLSLPRDILDEYSAEKRGVVSRSVMEEIASANDPAVQRKLWDQAKSGSGMTVRAARQAKQDADQPEDWKRRRSVENSINSASRTLTKIHEARDTLDPAQRQRLQVLRDMIDDMLS